ncbi:MAG: PD-(D/E)XK nuclease family protein [Defluviitaleaceae bacterium]|nr:PD-(D/E)XK nuclease family protein [Defluviitaleaceae bacterium]
MPVQFILGASGTGKTAYCLQAIKDNLNRLRGDAPLFYIVPEQNSLQAEKMLLFESDAAVWVQALSFGRLAYHVFAKAGGLFVRPDGIYGQTEAGERPLLNELGKNMLLRKIVNNSAGELKYYKNSNKQGFIDSLAQTVTEFSQYGVSVEEAAAKTDPYSALGLKLHDIAYILSRFKDRTSDYFFVSDYALDLLSDRIESSGLFSGGFVWVDGFHGFTPQEMKILEKIIYSAHYVGITAAVKHTPEADNVYQLKRNDFYFHVKETLNKLTAAAKSHGSEILSPILFEDDRRHEKFTELSFFCSQINSFLPVKQKYEKPGANEIEIVSASGRHEEVSEAINIIKQFVSQKKWRYKDIALLCGDVGSYEKLLRNAFAPHKIPLFADTKTETLSHPLVEFIRSAVDVAAHDFSYEGVFRFLKTGLTTMPRDDCDRLENYVLAHGVKGYRWRYAWPDAEAEENRRLVLNMLSVFTDGTNPEKEDFAKNWAVKIFQLISHLNVCQTLADWATDAAKNNDHELSRRHRQIWPLVCDVFDRMADIMGDEKINLRDLASVIETGFAQSGLGAIPPSADQVLLGDFSRTRFPPVKAMIVLGANDGLLPPPVSDTGLFGDDERDALKDAGIIIAPTTAERANENAFALNFALSQPQEKLIFIYSRNDIKGSRLRPAQIVVKTKKRFPNMTERVSIAKKIYFAVGETVWKLPENLSKLTADKIFGAEIITGISQLEKFVQCPFAHFLTYSLKIKERKIYEAAPLDFGILYHDIISAVSKHLSALPNGWRTLDKTQTDALVDRYTEKSVPSDGTHVLRSSERNAFMLSRLKNVCSRSIWALSEHIKRGLYEPVGFEKKFDSGEMMSGITISLANNKKLLLTGRVDRVDKYTGENRSYLKIIDYKSGKKKFDLLEAQNGVQMQLVLYMNALLNETDDDTEKLPGGIFYFNLDNPILDITEDITDEKAEEEILKTFCMSGLAVDYPEAVNALDCGLSEASAKSCVLSVSRNTDGSFSKNSSIIGSENFNRLQKNVNNKIESAGESMSNGTVKPAPYKNKSRSACDFCLFEYICGYSTVK